jgi:hypothetical protein
VQTRPVGASSMNRSAREAFPADVHVAVPYLAGRACVDSASNDDLTVRPTPEQWHTAALAELEPPGG